MIRSQRGALVDDASLLYVSDDPEKFTGHGRLFQATLPNDDRVARILFDHVNNGTGPMRVIVAIANTGEAAGNFAIAGFDAGPGPGVDGRNGMQVGHVATSGFLKARLLTPGGGITEHTIAAGESYVISSRVLQPFSIAPKKDGECTAGIYDFLVLDGGTTYELRTMAVDPSNNETAWDALPAAANPIPAHRSGVFDISGAGAEESIGFGAQTKFGDKHYDRVPEFDSSGQKPYGGEYGVIRRFTCDLGGEQSAFLYQFTGAPGATASYVVDEQTLLGSHQFLPGQPPDKVVELTAPSTSIITMAEINSSLPVTLKVGADDTALADIGSPGAKVFVA
jgi:hypothetical protein